jgi:hypothetical protein
MVRIRNLIANQRIPPPHKDAAGNYSWSPEDIERLLRAAPARTRGHAAAAGDRGKALAASGSPERAA